MRTSRISGTSCPDKRVDAILVDLIKVLDPCFGRSVRVAVTNRNVLTDTPAVVEYVYAHKPLYQNPV